MSESHWWYLTHKKWRAGTPQPGFQFDNLKPRLKSGIFKCISWLNGSFFFFLGGGGGCWLGFFVSGSQDLSMAPMSPINSPTFFCLHICSLWCIYLKLLARRIGFLRGIPENSQTLLLETRTAGAIWPGTTFPPPHTYAFYTQKIVSWFHISKHSPHVGPHFRKIKKKPTSQYKVYTHIHR